MTDMKKAAKRVADAIISGEKIAIWSDYDCDGIPGAVLLHDFLKKVGADFENYIPHRHDEGYGMNIEGIEKLAKGGVKLVVTVDSGITDVAPVARANELGLELCPAEVGPHEKTKHIRLRVSAARASRGSWYARHSRQSRNCEKGCPKAGRNGSWTWSGSRLLLIWSP